MVTCMYSLCGGYLLVHKHTALLVVWWCSKNEKVNWCTTIYMTVQEINKSKKLHFTWTESPGNCNSIQSASLLLTWILSKTYASSTIPSLYKVTQLCLLLGILYMQWNHVILSHEYSRYRTQFSLFFHLYHRCPPL